MTDKRDRIYYKKKRWLNGREALWIAILVHLIILFLPQSWNPFALFWQEPVQAKPDPVKFTFKQPENKAEPMSEITDIPEKQKALSPEEPQENAQSRQPKVKGQTNLKALETPPTRRAESQPTTQPETPPKETGMTKTQREQIQAQLQRQAQRNQVQRENRAQAMAEALEEMPRYNPSDFPITYDNPESSSAERSQGAIQFDTYDWNYEPYRAKMLRKIYEYWVPKLYTISLFRVGEPGLTVIRFIIQKDGSVSQQVLIRPAEVPNYDMAADHAINAPYWSLTTPFPPLPLDFPKEDLGVTIAFYVNLKPTNN